MYVAQLLAHFSFSLKAPPFIANGWHPVFILSFPLLGSLVAIPVIASALGQPDHVIKTLGTWSIDAYQIYIHTPISTIVRVASLRTWHVFLAYLSLFPVVFVRCLGTLVVRGQGFPQLWAPFPLRSGSHQSPFDLEWGLVAGLREFASHGASIPSRGSLATVDAPGYPRHPPST